MGEEIQVETINGKTESPPLQGILRIGELLVKEGFAREQDVQRALAIQRQEKEFVEEPLGQILVKTGALTSSQLDELLNHPDLRRDLGSIIQEKGLLERSRLESAAQRKPPDQYLGNFLVQEGLISPEALKVLLREQLDAPRLGELALLLGWIKDKDLEYALKVQKTPRAIGEILCDLGVVNPLDLHYVLNRHKKQSKLGEMLLKLGYVDQETLNKALQEQKHSSDSLGLLLVKRGLLSQQQLQEAVSRQCNIPFRTLEGFSYDETEKRRLSSIISQKYAEKNSILPISFKGKELTLALLSPETIQRARELKSLYNSLTITCVLITEQKFIELFEVLYSKRLGPAKSSEEEAANEGEKENVDFMQIELDEEMEAKDEGPVYDAQDVEAEEIVNFIIKYGISNGASDIHIEQDRDGTKLRYRIDGVLRDLNINWLTRKLQEKAGSIISRIKIISNLDIAERRLPQDGVFRINYYDKAKNQKTDLDFRVAICRAIAGENVVIRILDSRKANMGLEQLQHSPHVLEPFKQSLKSSAGMVLVTGPTGSGKSSTLYGALKYMYDPGLKIITAEDPIEYSFPGIMQTQVNPKINLGFARLMRSFLRLDPDVILVGEMRDEETVKIGFDAAQTGHLVLSTLHTNDSVSSLTRLLDLKVERVQIASCLSCVLAQRLVRRICSSCIREYVPHEEEWLLLFEEYPSHLKFYKGKGCEDCGFTGFKGRTLISEVFMVDKDAARALSNGVDVDDLKRLAVERGMLTMLDDGLLKLKQTTLSELTRVIPHEMIQGFRLKNRKERERARTGEMVPTDGFLIADPSKEVGTIDRMHQEYEGLSKLAGRSQRPVGREAFGRFIDESFREICRDYGCSRVRFNVEKRDGRVEILAAAGN
jgi:type IV pilus assembly protein PilB